LGISTRFTPAHDTFLDPLLLLNTDEAMSGFENRCDVLFIGIALR
jgi:hypothetical protein